MLRPRDPEELLESTDGGPPPYWTLSWPSGHGLAALLSERPLSGVRVLELGCGLGLPSLAALRGGADVLASDNEHDALALLRRNARRVAHRPLRTLLVDLVDEPSPALLELAPFDLVLAADVLYRPDLAEGIGVLLPRLLHPRGEALVAFAWPGQAAPIVELLEPQGWRWSIAPLPSPAAEVRSVELLTLHPPPA